MSFETDAIAEPPICFSRNDMTPAARAARKVLARGRVKSAKAKRAAPKRQDPLGPTPERLAKADTPVRSSSGIYRSPPPIERLRDRNLLDPEDHHLNEAMFRAAEKLGEVYAKAGLGMSAQAQDLNRIAAGSGEIPSCMAVSEMAAHARQQVRDALKVMGWSLAYPFRGAGRITVAVVCQDMAVEDAAKLYRPAERKSQVMGAGMEVLREGLFALAVHWRFTRA